MYVVMFVSKVVFMVEMIVLFIIVISYFFDGVGWLY